GVLVTAADFLSRPDARIIFYPAGYSIQSNNLRQLEQKAIALAESVAAESDDSKRSALQTQLNTLQIQINDLRGKDQVDVLQEDRAAANEHLMDIIIQLANPQLKDAARLNLGVDLHSTLQQIDQLDQKLGDLVRTENLP